MTHYTEKDYDTSAVSEWKLTSWSYYGHGPKPVNCMTVSEKLQRAMRLTAEGHTKLMGWKR